MKKAFPYILLGLLAIGALVVKRCRSGAGIGKKSEQAFNRNDSLDRRTSFLEYTEHAKCRMDCGHIETKTVEDILQNGQVNRSKSETTARPCPVYALEGYSAARQHLRIIFAQCDYKTKVVTCIALDSSFDCHCAGVGSKYEH